MELVLHTTCKVFYFTFNMYRVFQEKLHKICHAINSELFVLGLWCLHQNVQQSLLSIDQ